LAYSPEYYAANKEKFAAWDKRYREANKEKVKLRHKKYKASHKEQHADNERRRRARLNNAKSQKYTVDDIINLYGVNCHLCGKEVDLSANRRVGRAGWEAGLHVDHLIPVSASGDDTIDNVRPSHGLCNLRKNRYV
jgi:hypothetical protein